MKIIDSHLHLFPAGNELTDKMVKSVGHENSAEHLRKVYGELDMARLMKLYVELGIDVPIRVDHVPTMPGEVSTLPGYDALGRLYAMGYMRGLYETAKIK